MSTMDSKNIKGFYKEIWSGFDGRAVCEWHSQFSNYRVQTSKKGYNVIGKDDNHTTVSLMYFDTFEEAVYHVRYRAITNFLGDEY